MRKVTVSALVLLVFGWITVGLVAGEHGGSEHGGSKHTGNEHGGSEHGGSAHEGSHHEGSHGGHHKKPSADDIRAAMKSYVEEHAKKHGAFEVHDEVTGETLKLELVRVHERVGKTGDYYYSCADFKDTKSGRLLDLDLDVSDQGGKLSVVAVHVHKVDGKARYTYDNKDNKVPVA